ncbi:DUF2399 domain-containing protein [Streptomyces rubiginosohelvolus]|uniref:DUF2399 domain-containing protein n=1 Tax=Streptomyces rubiginosohelvolus TaxID=67362 RepID=UPI00371AF2ED
MLQESGFGPGHAEPPDPKPHRNKAPDRRIDLRLLADQGAALRYHGDFDGAVIRIAAYVMEKTGAHPWRMTAADYRSAIVGNAHGSRPGRITGAPWDPELAEPMAEHDIPGSASPT